LQTNLFALAPAGPRAHALEDALRAAIREGWLAAGEQVPPSRALATDLGLARATVVEAYAQLQAEGYLVARRGSGTWVADLPLGRRAAPKRASAARPARFSFDPGMPDLTAFPRTAWSRASNRGLRAAPASSLGYGDPRGRPELRDALAAYLRRVRGADADPELIVVCGGFSHALALLARLLRRRGAASIAMENPCLWWHRNIAALAGLDVVAVPVDEHGARTDRLGETSADALLLAPAHQFPTGALLHPERRTAAIAWARATDGLVIEDDYDAELRYDRPPIGALQALDPERVVHAGTASKTLAPGLRLGWMVLPPALVEPIVELRWAEDVHVPATEQIAFTELLVSGEFERHVRRLRARYRARRGRLLAVLAAGAPGARAVGISAGLRLLLELPAGSPSGEELAEEGAARSIELFPLASCYHGGRVPPDVRDGLVLGYAALPEHEFESGLAALASLLGARLPTARGRGSPWRSRS
jgi:GntR family transcriptional regulator/MocR family aminotransferase